METPASPTPRPDSSQQPPAAAPVPKRVPVPQEPAPEQNTAPAASQQPAAASPAPKPATEQHTAPAAPQSPTSPGAGHIALTFAHDAYHDAAQPTEDPFKYPATDQTHQEADTGDNHAVYTGYAASWNHVPNGSAPAKLPTIDDRLNDTLVHAELAQLKYAAKAKFTGAILQVAMLAQIVVNAMVTALAAAPGNRSTQVGVSVLGAIGTVLASFIVRLRSTQEPERSSTHAQSLERFIRELKGFKLDYGGSTDSKWDEVVCHFRREFDQLQMAAHQSESGQPMSGQKQGSAVEASQKV